MDRRLGRPLPYQLANPTQAHPIARGLAIPRFPPNLSTGSVCGISLSFPKLSPTTGQFPTRYSPVRHSSAPEGLLPFDLHVLSIPPAFNLSHDQTLQFNCMCVPFKIGHLIFFGQRNIPSFELTEYLVCQPVSLDTECQHMYPHSLFWSAC